MPDTPDTVPVYRLKYPDVTEEYALNIGDKFGVSEPLVDFKDSSGLYFLKNKHSDEGLEIALETGAILYHTNMKKLYPAEKPSLPMMKLQKILH